MRSPFSFAAFPSWKRVFVDKFGLLHITEAR